MAADITPRLLIIEGSANEAEAFVAALKAAGMSVRAHIFADADELETVIESHSPNIVLLDQGHPEIKLSEVLKRLKAATTPAALILMCERLDQINPALAIESGARDRVLKKDHKHLKAVVSRELGYIAALSRQQKLEKMYHESEVRCQTLMDHSRDAIAYVHQGMHIYANEAYLEMFGFEGFDDIEGLPIMDLIVAHRQEEFKNFLRKLDTHEGKKPQLETEFKDHRDEMFTGNVEFSEASIEGEPCTQIVIRQPDEVDTSALEEQINQLSKLDPLTSLLNRQSFLEEFDKAIASVSSNKHFSLFQVGLENFKEIQELVGLVGSDQVIAEIAGVIKSKLDSQDIAGRYEGSKYLILSHASTDKDINKAAQTIISAIDNHMCDIGGKSVHPKCHIGVSIIDDESLDVNEVMSRAQKAFSEAKERDDDSQRLSIYVPKEGEMTQKQLDANWIKRIKTALDSGNIFLLYQPIVQLDGTEVERYEVFMQMQDEQGERVPAGEFLPAAERTGMSKILDRWVINKALEQLMSRIAVHPETIFVIKLTGGSLGDMELFRWISDKLKARKVPKGRLIFEVKEEAVVSHLKQAQAFATLLKTIQCGFAIDDFGKGKDPFKLVELVPADYLKFHKDFSKDLFTNQQNQETLREISEKARELKKHTIVQHVEDAATLSVLWSIGNDFIQGNFFQGPSEETDYDFSNDFSIGI